MTISEQIRTLAGEGLATAEIAKRLGIRYQHAYNVLKRTEPALTGSPVRSDTVSSAKPPLIVSDLLARGFALSATWSPSPDGPIAPDRPLPKEVGVYAFAVDGVVQYVGVATMGLSKRIYFYGKPGITQRTSQRINKLIRECLGSGRSVAIYVALPPDLEWNGLPVHGSAGLELGLIKRFALPWNMRSAG